MGIILFQKVYWINYQIYSKMISVNRLKSTSAPMKMNNNNKKIQKYTLKV